MSDFFLSISKLVINADGFCHLLWIVKSHGFESFLV